MQEDFSNNDVGRRLAQIRTGKGYNQLEFAKIIGVSAGSLKNYERGFTEPPISLLQLLNEKYDINPNWVILGRQNPQYSAVAQTVRTAIEQIDTLIELPQTKTGNQYRSKMIELLFSLAMENEGKIDKTKFKRFMELASHEK